jgi:hypothetical protein
MLALQAGPQAEGHTAAATKGEILTGPAPGIRNKTLFGEFVVCQVKVLRRGCLRLWLDYFAACVFVAESERCT